MALGYVQGNIAVVPNAVAAEGESDGLRIVADSVARTNVSGGVGSRSGGATVGGAATVGVADAGALSLSPDGTR